MNWEKYKYYYIALSVTILLVVIGIIYFIKRRNMNANDNDVDETLKNKNFNINDFKFDAKGNYPDSTFGYKIGEYPTNGKNSKLVSSGGLNNNWGDTMGKALAFAKQSELFLGKNVLTSQKRDWVLSKSGNVSDHSIASQQAYGIDLAVDVPTGDRLLAHLMQWFGNESYKGGNWENITKDGYRYQIGWRVPGHFNHIHIGVKKV